MRRLVAAPVALLFVLTLAGCGNSKSSSSSKDTSETTTSLASSTTEAAPLTSTPTDKIPEIGNATDLTKAPSVSPGAAPPPTELQFKDLVAGNGAVAKSTDTVNVQYYGANYADGKEFDSTWTRGGQPTSFPLNGVIKGFSLAITGMKVGSRRVVVIPPDLGYGANGSPPAVGPNETLVFVIDLVGIQ
ncbi:MAG TPA: FKBP-type peptidyl-prolyl cis-trans isomerase [Acidimicrobiales bacterium]|nr:FKBP-type peptidyl-prolyl cis-trans isomerase [Acidimicrobiales bacterium]